jgi:bacteriocin-like protein
MKKNSPDGALQQKDANPHPKTSKEELSDNDLNKVNGGSLKIVKLVDASSPKIYER